MKLKNIVAIYFSPTGNTFNILKYITNNISEALDIPARFISITLPIEREKTYSFRDDELVIFGSPVYAGRIPNKILPYIQDNFRGKNTPAMSVVTFGNRSYDNALAELCGVLNSNSFISFSATAIATTHVFSNKIGTDRPDKLDNNEIDNFISNICNYVRQKEVITEIKVKGQWPGAPYYKPLGLDLNPVNFLKAKPITNDNCDNCGKCISVCPMGSIDKQNPALITGTCIKCQACIKTCHLNAKYFDDINFISHVKMLENNYTKRTKSEFFI